MTSVARLLRILLPLSLQFHARTFIASGLVDMLVARGHRLTVLARDGLRASVAEALAGRADVQALEPYLPGPATRWDPRGRAKRWVRERFRTASYVQQASSVSTYRHKLARRVSWAAATEIALIRGLARSVDVERLAQGLEARLVPIKRPARRLVARLRPDVLVTPTTIHDALDIELVKAAREAGVPVLAFPASWDTLTSKGCFLVKPDAIMVWGQDTEKHAVDYHHFDREDVFVTGPPHFDVYGPAWPAEPRERFLGRRGIDPGKRVLLFVGTTVTYWADEPIQIRALSARIASGELADCVVWYRPHPRRTYEHMAEFVGLPGVHVDDEILRQKRAGIGYSAEREDLPHYRGLIDACDGVIAAFSTMIIEAALMGKPSLVVAFGLADDTPDRVLQHAEYEHFRDVLGTPGVTLIRSLPELLAEARRIVGGEYASYQGLLRKRASEIAHAEDGRARERVVDAIERVAGRGADR